MTPDEYALAVEELIEDNDLKTWEIYDLRLYVRLARKHTYVPRMYVVFLNFVGKKEVYIVKNS